MAKNKKRLKNFALSSSLEVDSLKKFVKKLLYVCEADSGGIMEYAIWQVEAIVREGIKVHFLCRESFPVDRLAKGIVVEKFEESRVSSVQRRGLAGKILRVLGMISDLRSEAKQVAQLSEKLLKDSSTRNSLPATRHRPGPAEVTVLFACYKEYFAPFWVGPLRRLAQRGVLIGTIAHDPVRDFVVGPLWWHRWSVRLGYSFVRHVFVHDDTPVDFGGKRPYGIEVHQIPHGPYEVAEPKIGRIKMRRRLGFSSDLTTEDTESTEVEAGPCLVKPSCASESDSLASGLADAPVSKSLTRSADGPTFPATSHSPPATAPAALALDAGRSIASAAPATLTSEATFRRLPHATPCAGGLDTSAPADVVFLAFGQIRDGKNLDLSLRAMTRLPENVKLLVAGKGDSGSSRPPEFYQRLAEELGVAERCRWDIRRIPEEEVGDIFAACDVVLVTYSAKFRSASGVLNAAVSARKPVLASSGPSPLKTVVEKYQLGVFVEPDNLEEILRGAQMILDSIAPPASLHPLPDGAPKELALNSRRSTLKSTQPLATSTLLNPDWARYEIENSWEENARIVIERLEGKF